MTQIQTRPTAPWPVVAVIALAILQIVTPALPALGIGRSIGDRSQVVETLVTPAGWAFSIWGPLYAGSLLFAVYQARAAARDRALVAQLRWPAAGAFAGNAIWAAYVQVAGLTAVSVIVIGWTLGCLLVAYRRLSAWPHALTRGERWCAVVPLSALAGWLTVATTVNVAAAMRFHGVEGGDAAPAIAAAVVIAAGAIAGIALWRGRGNPAYAAVLLWALSAIHAAGGRSAGSVAAGVSVAVILVVAGAWSGRRRSRHIGNAAILR